MLSDEYGGALLRGFQFANEVGVTCGPVHFLVGVAEGDGPAARALSGSGRSLRDVVTTERATLGQGSMHLNGQVQGAARLLAEQLGMGSAAEHLLVAVLDQGTPQVLTVFAVAGIDPARRGPPRWQVLALTPIFRRSRCHRLPRPAPWIAHRCRSPTWTRARGRC